MIYPIFDYNHQLVPPTILLCRRNKNVIGELYPIDNWSISPDIAQSNECSFTVYKEVDGKINPYWNDIIDFKLIYLKEYDEYLEIEVDKEASTTTKKTIVGKNLGIAETSQTQLYDIEINTESDILNDNYVRATLWSHDVKKQNTTILGRVLSKMPHYKVKHVDESIINIFKTFSISDTSVCDFLTKTLAEEIDCLTIIGSDRTVSLYDLEDSCLKCGHREPDMTICPECGNTNIRDGYGTNTSIYMSLDNLCDTIKVSTEKDKVKNTFRIAGGDDLMTSTIRAINPNGSQYIYMFSQDTYNDMTQSLRDKLKSYMSEYNRQKPIYANLMKQVYDAQEEILKLESGMAPDPYPYTLNDEKKRIESALNNKSVAISSMKNASKSVVETAIQNYTEALVDIGFTTTLRNGSYNTSTKKWTGNVRISSIYTLDKEESEQEYVDTVSLTININDNVETFTQQKITKIASKKSAQEIYNIESDTDFKKALTQYNLERLKSFALAYQGCLDIIIEMGNNKTNNEFKTTIYDKYKKRLDYINAEIKTRDSQIKTQNTLLNNLQKKCQDINIALNMEKYLGATLYYEFLAYRCEDQYQNDNYISEGLSTTELTKKAQELFEVAEKELYKACETQYVIDTTIGNLFAIDEFKAWQNHFKIGSWMRIYDGDSIFKIRLISYDIQGNDYKNLPIKLSNVTKISTGYSDIQSILNSAISMSSSYDSVKRQAKEGSTSKEVIDTWTSKGIEAGIVPFSTNDVQEMTINENGLLGRVYDDITGTYSNEQLRISNNTLAITDDNWETVKAAIGKVYYVDPNTQETVNAYGVLADVLIGKLILGEALQIVNQGGTLNFDNNGLLIRNAKNIFRVNPNNTNKLFSISKIENNKETDILYVDANGNGVFKGEIQSTSGHIANWKITSNELYHDSSNKSAGMSADGTNPSFWAGTTYANRANAPTRIMPDGKLYSTSAELTGDITTNNSLNIYNSNTKVNSTITNGLVKNLEHEYWNATGSSIYQVAELPNTFKLLPNSKFTYHDGELYCDGMLYSNADIHCAKDMSAYNIESWEMHTNYLSGIHCYTDNLSVGENGKTVTKISGDSTVLNITNKTTSALLIDNVNYNKDIFFVTNGDGIANNVHIQGTTIQDGKCYVVFDRELSDTKIRVNWVRFTLA